MSSFFVIFIQPCIFQHGGDQAQTSRPEDAQSSLADLTVENSQLKAELRQSKDSLAEASLRIAQLVNTSKLIE